MGIAKREVDLSGRCLILRNAKIHCYLPKMQQSQT